MCPPRVAADDSSSDADAPLPSCPLCAIEEVEPEHASGISSDHNFLRRIMAEELKSFGVRPDSVIYNKIARMYNRHVNRAMRERGLPCERWTGAMVQVHFEQHIRYVPRRVLGQYLSRLERSAKLVDTEIATRQLQEATEGAELIDAKTITKQCNLAKTAMYLVRDLNSYIKEDKLQKGTADLWKSVELGKTTAAEAKELLDKAALLQTAAGAGDRPAASDLFD